jgi:ATPases involved in chromosome partitioning
MVEYSRLTPEVRNQFLNVIQAITPKYDVVLLDTGAGISDVVLFSVSLASEVLIVATPEPTSLTDAYAAIKVLAMQQKRQHVRMVINQAARRAMAVPSPASCSRCSTALSAPNRAAPCA